MIHTIIVDDERIALDALAALVQPGFELAGSFTNPLEALDFAEKCRAGARTIDFALLDIEMPSMNGMELGARLKALNPKIIIIYITAHGRYALDALRLKADYFIVKPFSKSDILDAFERARLLSARRDKRVVIKALGNFEVMLDGKRLVFTNAKAKELLALCVDRQGAELSINDAVATLWEGRNDDVQVKKLYRKAVIYLDDLFEKSDCDGVFAHARGMCWIDPSLVSCDYFDCLEGDKSLFKGKYMSQYSWGEETLGDMAEWDGEI